MSKRAELHPGFDVAEIVQNEAARKPSKVVMPAAGLLVFVMALVPSQDVLAAPAFANVCTGLGVSVPALAPVGAITDGLLIGLLAPVAGDFNTLVGGINTNVQSQLSGRQLSIGVLNPATNTFVNTPSNDCYISASGLAVDNNMGLSLGGGQISGLGGTGNLAASAGDVSAIAFGNGSSTGVGAINAVALGSNATASAANSVALGASSSAERGALNNYTAFGLIGGQSSTGEVSIGSTGATRQLTNVAAGSSGTDAANVFQLQGAIASVGTSISGAIGGGSTYNAVTGQITNPSYFVGGRTYNNVGAAIGALNTEVNGGGGGSPYFSVNSVLGVAQATGANALGAGPTANASGNNSVAIGNGSATSGANSVALGSGSTDGGQANVVSVGAPGAERRIVDVGAGSLSAASTDAVNGSQLYQTNAQLASVGHTSVQYDSNGNGGTLSSVSLSSDQGGPVIIHNLAPGVAASDAATVGQLQGVGANAVQYATANGVRTNTVALAGGQPGGVVISNVAPGVLGTDAVNLNQLQAATGGNNAAAANAYTDQRINNLAAYTQQQISKARRDAAGGTAIALAAAGLRYEDRPGRVSITGGTSYYSNQVGMAVGISTASENGRLRLNAAVTGSPSLGHVEIGAVFGAAYSLN